MPEQFDIGDLIQRCTSGDDSAHAEFYNLFHPYLQNVARNQLVKLNVYYNQGDVEDLTNDVIVGIASNNYAKLTQIRNPDKIHSWLLVVARNQVNNHVRNEARRDTVTKQYAKEGTESYNPLKVATIERAEDRERVQKSLKSLDERERLVVTMYYIDRLKYHEISDLLTININTVATLIRRVKEKLRHKLKQNADD